MRDDDYKILTKLEEAFDKNDIAYFISFLERSKNLPLLLRVHAVCMLEHIGNEEVIGSLCNVLKEDTSPVTRHEAAFTLGQLGYRAAVPALVEAMADDLSPIVRHESAVALSSIGDDSVLPDLEQAIEDKDEDVRNSALIAFEYLTYLRMKRQRTPKDTPPKTRIRL